MSREEMAPRRMAVRVRFSREDSRRDRREDRSAEEEEEVRDQEGEGEKSTKAVWWGEEDHWGRRRWRMREHLPEPRGPWRRRGWGRRWWWAWLLRMVSRRGRGIIRHGGARAMAAAAAAAAQEKRERERESASERDTGDRKNKKDVACQDSCTLMTNSTPSKGYLHRTPLHVMYNALNHCICILVF